MSGLITRITTCVTTEQADGDAVIAQHRVLPIILKLRQHNRCKTTEYRSEMRRERPNLRTYEARCRAGVACPAPACFTSRDVNDGGRSGHGQQ